MRSSNGVLSIRRPTPTVGQGNSIIFQLNNASNVKASYAGVGGLITNNTAGAENGDLILSATLSGTLAEKARITSVGTLIIGAGTTAGAQLNLVPGVAPSSPNDGDLYYVNTNDRLMFRKNALDAEIISASAVTTEVVVSDTTLTITNNGVTYKLLARA